MLLTVKEVASELKTSPHYVYKLINAGLLPCLQLGTKKVRREALVEFLAKYEGKNIDEMIGGK